MKNKARMRDGNVLANHKMRENDTLYSFTRVLPIILLLARKFFALDRVQLTGVRSLIFW
jgi:hypothetical protein